MYIATEMKINQVYSILMNDWDEEITGVFIAEGKEWILLYDNQNDFLVEGLRFIHKQNLDEVLREDDEVFKEKIFNLKYPKLPFDYSFDLDNSVTLLKGLQANNALLHFDTDDEDEITVGRIEEVSIKNFKLKSLTSSGEWGESCICDFSEITSIAIQNDYLNSLSLLLK
tara:strand:+ start:15058 stop:15567 length:510 start_codon:yes stop_codon:yes gene_type:complete